MTFHYVCYYEHESKEQTWNGEVRIIQHRTDYCEAEATARGNRFHLICGKHQNGNYLCIPNWSIGSELGYLSDRFWNLERLTTYFPELSKADAISIVDALVTISKNISPTV